MPTENIAFQPVRALHMCMCMVAAGAGAAVAVVVASGAGGVGATSALNISFERQQNWPPRSGSRCVELR